MSYAPNICTRGWAPQTGPHPVQAVETSTNPPSRRGRPHPSRVHQTDHVFFAFFLNLEVDLDVLHRLQPESRETNREWSRASTSRCQPFRCLSGPVMRHLLAMHMPASHTLVVQVTPLQPQRRSPQGAHFIAILCYHTFRPLLASQRENEESLVGFGSITVFSGGSPSQSRKPQLQSSRQLQPLSSHHWYRQLLASRQKRSELSGFGVDHGSPRGTKRTR